MHRKRRVHKGQEQVASQRSERHGQDSGCSPKRHSCGYRAVTGVTDTQTAQRVAAPGVEGAVACHGSRVSAQDGRLIHEIGVVIRGKQAPAFAVARAHRVGRVEEMDSIRGRPGCRGHLRAAKAVGIVLFAPGEQTAGVCEVVSCDTHERAVVQGCD